jgi:hypothetical protein
MSYQPAVNTVAWKAITHLQSLPAGAELMTSALAEAIGVAGANLLPCLDAALKHGAIYRRQRDTHARSPMWWSLTDHGARPKVDIRQPAVPVAEKDAPQEGANRDASAGQSHDAAGSASPAGRGTNGVSARGAAPDTESAHSLAIVGGRRLCSVGENGDDPLLTPASLHNGREQTKPVSGLPDQSAPELAPRKKGQPLHPELGPQQVMKAEPATADATDRGAPDIASPRVGAMGAGQPADAGPAGKQPPSVQPVVIPGAREEPEGAAAIAGRPATAKETTQRGAGRADIAATRETATSAGDDAKPAVGAAAPDGFRCALWSNGALQLERGAATLALLTADETRALVAYLERLAA